LLRIVEPGNSDLFVAVCKVALWTAHGQCIFLLDAKFTAGLQPSRLGKEGQIRVIHRSFHLSAMPDQTRQNPTAI